MVCSRIMPGGSDNEYVRQYSRVFHSRSGLRWMLKIPIQNRALRKRASQFGRLVRHSAITPRTGQAYKPTLVANDELGVTFIGHSSFFVQIGGLNVVIDPNFASWLFVLKRLRQPGVKVRDLPPIDLVLVTHAHFDHLHRSVAAVAGRTNPQSGWFAADRRRSPPCV